MSVRAVRAHAAALAFGTVTPLIHNIMLQVASLASFSPLLKPAREPVFLGPKAVRVDAPGGARSRGTEPAAYGLEESLEAL